MANVAEAIARLRNANGPGGRSKADIEVVCDAAEDREFLRSLLRECGICLANAWGAEAARLHEQIEDLLDEKLPRSLSAFETLRKRT